MDGDLLKDMKYLATNPRMLNRGKKFMLYIGRVMLQKTFIHTSTMEGMVQSATSGPSLLPPGFRFHPTDEDLIIFYLKQKVLSSSNPFLSIIADINIYMFNPWELPVKAKVGETEWFFFSPRDRKYPNGARPNRAAASGYWKATGIDTPILSSCGSMCLGVKKALVFYVGRAPKGIKTNWMMQEYRLLDDTCCPHRVKGSMRVGKACFRRCHLITRRKIGCHLLTMDKIF